MKNSNDGFHLGNLIKKHIYFRNKTVKEVAMHLDLNEKTFSDHLNKPKMLSDELFRIADYLELSLDYVGDMSKNKLGLLGQKVCRLNKNSHKVANELVSFGIDKIKSIEGKDVNNIITELKKTYNGLGYVIDALLPLYDSDTDVPYQVYVKDSRVRGHINSGEYVIWPPFGKELDMDDYEEFLNGQDGASFLKALLRSSSENECKDCLKNNGFDPDGIHFNYEGVNENEILRLWKGRRIIKNKKGEIICIKQFGPGRSRFRPSEYSRAEYYYILGMKNLEANKYYDALIDFNTAEHIYYDDVIFIDSKFYEGLRKVACENHGYNPLNDFDLYYAKFKVLKKLGLHKNLIENILKISETEHYKEFENNKDVSSCDFIIELHKTLLNAYIKEKQFCEALTVCDILLELVDFRSEFNIRIVKSLVLEQMGDYNAALGVIEEDFFDRNILEWSLAQNENLTKKYYYEFIKANQQGNKLLQIMKDKGITIEVESFIDDEDEEC